MRRSVASALPVWALVVRESEAESPADLSAMRLMRRNWNRAEVGEVRGGEG
jgi:hypothetical protein